MERLDFQKAVAAIKKVLPPRRPIQHHEPFQNGSEYVEIDDFITKGITSYKHTEKFEEELRHVTGADNAIAVSNGTAALHLSLLATGVRAGEEVLVPTLTYAATANAVTYVGATPNFIDGVLCINPFKLKQYLAREFKRAPDGRGCINKSTDKVVSAIIIVHLLGTPCDIKAIRRITDEYNLILIEDAAEALGSREGNTFCGNMGDMSILSFNHNKIITTGGGGAVLSNDPMLIAKAYQLAHQGRTDHPWLVEHDVLGYNYAMPSICAALGVAQIRRLPTILKKKRQINNKYHETLQWVEGLKFTVPLEGDNCWLNWLLCDYPEDRDLLLKALHKEGIYARALFSPLHTLPFYRNNPRDSNLKYAEHTAARAVCLPSGVGISDETTPGRRRS